MTALLVLAITLCSLSTTNAQMYQTVIRYVDGLNGTDGPYPQYGTAANPFQTITYALSNTQNYTGVRIKVIGQYSGGAPVRHSLNMPGGAAETFPITIPRGTTIEKDLTRSAGPVIIDGTGVITRLVDLGWPPPGLNIAAGTGLKDIWLYNISAPNPAVYVRGIGQNKSSKPRILNCRFNRCYTGVYVATGKLTNSKGEASPTIQNSTFFNYLDPWMGSGLSPVKAHISVYAKGKTTGPPLTRNTASPTITGCKIYEGPETTYLGNVNFGVRVEALEDALAAPTISSSKIGVYPISIIPQPNRYGMLAGVRSVAHSGGITNFKLQGSTVRGCKDNGVEMISYDANNVPSSPEVSKCYVSHNGYGVTTLPTDQVRYVDVPRGHGIAVRCGGEETPSTMGHLSPTIRYNWPQDGGAIAYNWMDGINITAKGRDETGEIYETAIQTEIFKNEIRGNGRSGVTNFVDKAWSKMKVWNNTIRKNQFFGVLNIAIGAGEASQENPLAQAGLYDNVIHGSASANTQKHGVWNERYGVDPNFSYNARAILYEVNDTVAQNWSDGIMNVDPLNSFNAPSQVWNTISYYNNTAGNDIKGFGQNKGNVRYCDYSFSYTGNNYKNISIPPNMPYRASYDFRLKYVQGNPTASSPCIDWASNSPYPYPAILYDFQGLPRKVQKSGIPDVSYGNYCDMGANEVQ